MATIQRDEATPPVPLTIDEIRTVLLLQDAFQEAQAQMRQAKELQDKYLDRLRANYGLGQDWACVSVLEGFVHFVVVEENNG